MIRLLLLSVLFSASFGFTQSETLRSYAINAGTVSIETTRGTYSINYHTNGAVETSFQAVGEEDKSVSHAVISAPMNATIAVKRAQDLTRPRFYIFDRNVEAIEFSLDSVPFKINYFFNGQLMVAQESFAEMEQGYELILGISDNEALYGGGARALGMDRRGNKLELYNRAHYGYETHAPLMNYCIPMYLSSKGYAVHFDAPGTGWLDLDSSKSNRVTYSTVSNRKTYQVIVGNDWKTLLENWTHLSGRQPKLPIWALGNFASRFGYHSQGEVENLVDQFRAEEIPLDAVVLDLYWFGTTIQGTLGNLAFHRDSFPDPEGMMRKLNEQNVKTVLVTEPFILTTSNRWEEAVNGDVLAKDSTGNPLTYNFYFGNTGLIDVFDEKASNWFWKRYLELKQMGVSGFWGDLGEPEVHPDEMIHATGTAREVHNIYGHKWAQMVYEGLTKSYPNERPFILMRSGSSGSQRYGLIPWSGDVNRTWGGLRSQPEIALQMGMQGLPFMHSDLGGFAGANDDPELYVRWLQYGVFQPVFRPHAQEEVASEPIFKDDNTKALAKKAIELRYKLLPYNYTLMCDASSKGTPLMRPVFFADENMGGQTNKAVDSVYFWGDAFFIAPVLSKGQKVKTVQFPEGSNWFDFYSGTLYKGGTTAQIDLNMSHIPTFVRGESFVPMVENLQSTADYLPQNVIIHYYVDPTAQSGQGKFEYDNGGDASKSFVGADQIQFETNWKGKKGMLVATSQSKNTTKLSATLQLGTSGLKKIKVNGKKLKINPEDRTISLIDVELIDGKFEVQMTLKRVSK